MKEGGARNKYKMTTIERILEEARVREDKAMKRDNLTDNIYHAVLAKEANKQL